MLVYQRFIVFHQPSPTVRHLEKPPPIHTSLGDPLGSFGHIGAIGLGKNQEPRNPGRDIKKVMRRDEQPRPTESETSLALLQPEKQC